MVSELSVDFVSGPMLILPPEDAAENGDLQIRVWFEIPRNGLCAVMPAAVKNREQNSSGMKNYDSSFKRSKSNTKMKIEILVELNKHIAKPFDYKGDHNYGR